MSADCLPLGKSDVGPEKIYQSSPLRFQPTGDQLGSVGPGRRPSFGPGWSAVPVTRIENRGIESTMAAEPSDVTLLDDPVARELLASTQVSSWPNTWSDGTPRVVPIWFHFDGELITMCSPPRAPKLHVLADRPEVAITIDDERAWPHRALLIRGRAQVEMLGELAPEYEAAARRYLGDEQAEAWVAPLRGLPMARISVRPTWLCVLDFVTRFPSALSA